MPQILESTFVAISQPTMKKNKGTFIAPAFKVKEIKVPLFFRCEVKWPYLSPWPRNKKGALLFSTLKECSLIFPFLA